MKLTTKASTWLWVYLLVVALPLISLAWFYLYSFKTSQTSTQLQNLSSIADKKDGEIETFINERMGDAAIHSKRQSVLRAIPELSEAFKQGGIKAAAIAGEKYQVEYSMLIEHDLFYDVLLLDLDGNVVFSLLHESDFGQNVLKGSLNGTPLADGFDAALSTMSSDLTPFRPYSPSNEKIASFVVSPVIVDEVPIGAMAFQLNLDTLTHVITDRTGLGVTGSTVLAEMIQGKPTFTAPLIENPQAAFKQTVPSTYNPPILKAIAGEHGQGQANSYSGEAILAAWRYLPHLNWGMVVKINTNEALAPVSNMQQIIFITLSILLTISAILMHIVYRHFALSEQALINSNQLITENEAHLQSVIDNVIDAIITINAQGEITSFNRAAEKIFGYQASEVFGLNIKMLMPEPYRSAHDQYMQNYLTTGVQKIIGIGRQVQGMRQNGEIFPLELAVSEIARHGEIVFVGLVRDISERIKVDKMKNEFVSTVSHELRTPLTAINGSLKLLDSAMFQLPDKAKPLVEIALRNGERLIFLINDLLDIEKIASGKMPFDMKNIAIMPLIEQSIQQNHAYAAQFKVKLDITQRIPEDTLVYADTQRLQQVLANLMSNAAKFSPVGEVVHIQVKQTLGKVHVSVINKGAGIPEAFHSRIFQKFSQADSSDTRQKGGTGLGLAITKAIVEHMGGQIGFTSQVDEKTEFYFWLNSRDTDA